MRGSTTNSKTSALAICLPLLVQGTVAILARDLQRMDRAPTTIFDLYPFPQITAAPSPELVKKRLGQLVQRSVIINTCATDCIASAVTKSTDCSIGDYGCECLKENQQVIFYGALNCIEEVCGAIEANCKSNFSLAQICAYAFLVCKLRETDHCFSLY